MADKMTLKEFHLKIARETNNGIWPALDKKKPSAKDLDAAIRMAHTARYHWEIVGSTVNLVRAEYMLSRVYAKKGLAEPAVAHAKVGLKLARKAKKEDPNWKDWDMPFIYEALSRAYSVAGNNEECVKFKVKAQRAINRIVGAEDKKICQGELDQISC